MAENNYRSPEETVELQLKWQDDVKTALFLGASTVSMTVLTALIMLRWLNRLELPGYGALVAASLIASVVFWFVAKKDDRWMVLCTLINHFGIGVGLYLLLDYLDAQPQVKDLALGLLPAVGALVLFCLLYPRTEEGSRTLVSWGGIFVFAGMMVFGFLSYAVKGSAMPVVLCVCAAVSLGSFGALLWTSGDPERSIHRTMALVSFTIYLILLAVAAIVLMTQGLGSSSDNNRSKSRSRSSSSKSGGSGSRSSVSIPSGSYGVRRTRSYHGPSFFYPVYLSTYHRTYDSDRYVDPESSARARRRISRFVKWAFVILAVILTTVVLIAIIK